MSEYHTLAGYAATKHEKLLYHEFIHTATVEHGDGSILYLKNCLVEDKENFIIVFTEHLGWFVFEAEYAAIMYNPNVNKVKVEDLDDDLESGQQMLKDFGVEE
jgi:hypothetical protein